MTTTTKKGISSTVKHPFFLSENEMDLISDSLSFHRDACQNLDAERTHYGKKLDLLLKRINRMWY